MTSHNMPDMPEELYRRINLFRRDIGNMLFHFTRTPESDTFIEIKHEFGTMQTSASASSVLRKILTERSLHGTSRWTNGENCVCFTEAPIQEFNTVFSLVEIASSKKERPRYEPYGVALTKEYIFKQGGRPVIYEHPTAFAEFPSSQRYRLVPYDPVKGVDFTWEREWRIRTDRLRLDPKHTLAIVPSSDEAFDLVYEFADMEADYDRDGSIMGAYHKPKWLAVSLDLFGLKFK